MDELSVYLMKQALAKIAKYVELQLNLSPELRDTSEVILKTIKEELEPLSCVRRKKQCHST